MIRLLQSRWMIPLIGGLIYLATTTALIQPGKLHVARPTSANARPALGPSWNFRNPEFEQMVEDLKAQKEILGQREQKLKELETRLQTERQEVFAVTQMVARLQQEFDSNVVRLKEEETGNLKRLAKLHATMSPDASANILREASDEEAAKVLAYMKVDEAGAVLEAFVRLGKDEAKRAAQLSDRMRRTISPAPAPAGKPITP